MRNDSRNTYSQAGIRIIERDGETVWIELDTGVGTVVVMANIARIEDRLVIDRAHVEGEGLDLSLIRRFAKVMGEVEDVVEVIVQGGRRTSGKRAGTVPTPIRVKVR